MFINLCNAYMVHNYEANRDWCFSAFRNNDCCVLLGKRGSFPPLQKEEKDKGSIPKPLLGIANKPAKQLNKLLFCFLCVILTF